MSLNWSSKKNFGKNVLSNPNFSAPITSSPVEEMFFTIVMRAVSAGSASLYCEADIEYIAVWTELRDTGAS